MSAKKKFPRLISAIISHNLWITGLVFPLIISLITSLFSFYLQEKNKKGKVINYSIEGPITYLEPTTNSPSSIIINGIQTQSLYGYKVHLWNSGDHPIENLQVLYNFSNTSSIFSIINVAHKTIPSFQFGNFIETPKNSCSKLFEYQLINENDEIFVNFLTNDLSDLQVWAKLKGLKISEIKSSKSQQKLNEKLSIIIPSVLIFFIAALSISWLRANKLNRDIEFTINMPKNIIDNFKKIDTESKKELLKLNSKTGDSIKSKTKSKLGKKK